MDLPTPSAATVRACEQVARELPDSIGKGMSRRRTTPASPLVAAWGSPAAIYRCGVPIDAGFAPGDQVFQIERDGATVGWYAVERGDVVVWSNPLSTVHVEVLVPKKYQGAGLLALLTPAVSKARIL